ncbi:serine hydrolase [Frigoribacterium salinisoli]
MSGGDERRGGRRRGGGTGGARHGGERSSASFDRSFGVLAELAHRGATVSAAVHDLDSGEELFAVDERVALPIAQVGALLLLVEVAAQLEEGRLSPLTSVPRGGPLGDDVLPGASGLWPYLRRDAFSVVDAATLVGALRDASAINALVARIGLDAVRARAEQLGLRRTALLDIARPDRGPDDAPDLAVGSAHELADLWARLVRGEVVDPAVSDRVLGWASLSRDLSLAASAFGLDPGSHRRRDHDLQLVHVTGAAVGVRSESGVLRGSRRGVAWAVTVTFDDRTLGQRLQVLDAYRVIGTELLEHVH